jgi:hypothetical protein
MSSRPKAFLPFKDKALIIIEIPDKRFADRLSTPGLLKMPHPHNSLRISNQSDLLQSIKKKKAASLQPLDSIGVPNGV